METSKWISFFLLIQFSGERKIWRFDIYQNSMNRSEIREIPKGEYLLITYKTADCLRQFSFNIDSKPVKALLVSNDVDEIGKSDFMGALVQPALWTNLLGAVNSAFGGWDEDQTSSFTQGSRLWDSLKFFFPGGVVFNTVIGKENPELERLKKQCEELGITFE